MNITIQILRLPLLILIDLHQIPQMEDFKVRTTILGKEVILVREDFAELRELIDRDRLIKQGHRLTDTECKLINHMLYFILFVNQKIPFEGFEDSVRKSLSSVYIDNKMRIRLYDYGSTCSQILTLDIYECIHAIYYLMYGRFASVSYVNMVVASRKDPQRLRSTFQRCSQSPRPESPVSSLTTAKKATENQRCSIAGSDLLANQLERILNDVPQTKVELPKDKRKQSGNRTTQNNLEIKFSRIRDRQTSPLMNILLNQTQPTFKAVRMKRKALNYTQTSFSQTLSTRKQKATVPSLDKSNKDKFNIRNVLEIRQKLKADNAYLDRLGCSLRPEFPEHFSYRKYEDHHHQHRSLLIAKQPASPAQPAAEATRVSTDVKFDANNVIEQVKGESDREEVRLESEQDTYHYNQENDSTGFDFKLFSSTQKTPFRIKPAFYKRKFKEFLKQYQQMQQTMQ